MSIFPHQLVSRKSLSVNIGNGDILIKKQRWMDILIPEILSSSRNNFAPVEIGNETEETSSTMLTCRIETSIETENIDPSKYK